MWRRQEKELELTDVLKHLFRGSDVVFLLELTEAVQAPAGSGSGSDGD